MKRLALSTVASIVLSIPSAAEAQTDEPDRSKNQGFSFALALTTAGTSVALATAIGSSTNLSSEAPKTGWSFVSLGGGVAGTAIGALAIRSTVVNDGFSEREKRALIGLGTVGIAFGVTNLALSIAGFHGALTRSVRVAPLIGTHGPDTVIGAAIALPSPSF